MPVERKVCCIIETEVGMSTLTDLRTSLRVAPSLLGIGPGASLCGRPRPSTAPLPASTTSPRQAHFRPTLFFPFLSRQLMHTYTATPSHSSIRRATIMYTSSLDACITCFSWWMDPHLHARVPVSAQSIAMKQDTTYKIDNHVYTDYKYI